MKKILLIAGHGKKYNGTYDPGAVSIFGEEAKFARELVTLVQQSIGSCIPVEVYDQDKNCYSYSQAGYAPDYKAYDIVVEIHFNAKVKKDESGDGQYTGIGAYTHPNNPGKEIAKDIVSAVTALGFKRWQICSSTGLYNLKQAQKVGTSYLLLETAFLDDGDDMNWYNSNKRKVAKAIAQVLIQTAKESGTANILSSSDAASNEGCEPAFRVQVKRSNLYIRKGPGTSYKKNGYCPIGVYHIVETRAAEGYTWGRLKSGAGWIALEYAKRL
mgnify:CR=1 FL=1